MMGIKNITCLPIPNSWTHHLKINTSMDKYIKIIESALVEKTLEYDTTKIQPALMTLPEYLSHRNPRGKMHDSSAYKTTLYDLNVDISKVGMNRVQSNIPHRGNYYTVWSNEKEGDKRFMIVRMRESVVRDNEDPVAFLSDGVVYYDPLLVGDDFVKTVFGSYDVEYQKTKYLGRQYKKASVSLNQEPKGRLLRRMRIDNGEYIEFRQDTHDQFQDMKAYNEDGYVVGSAQDEWGAVLVRVADEYKGFGIGRVLQKLYTDAFPDKESGGFTPSGLSNAKKVWQKEVRKFLAGGVYSNMIRKGTMDKDRVDDILSGLDGNVKIDSYLPKKVEQKQKKYLIYYNGSNAFILYDKQYLIDQDEEYIYAYVHLEESHDSKLMFPYRVEYESDKDRQTILYIAIQEIGEIDTNFAGSDFFKYDDMKFLENDNGVLRLSKQIFSNLDAMYANERRLRNDVDQYNELLYTLLETAEAKWK